MEQTHVHTEVLTIGLQVAQLVVVLDGLVLKTLADLLELLNLVSILGDSLLVPVNDTKSD